MTHPKITTWTGQSINLLDPDPDTIIIEDIAWSLSHLCRFTGHTSVPFSVAEHSINVSNNFSDLALEGLLHDAQEAYIGDVSSPLKSLLPEYKKIEKKFESVIRKKFGLTTDEDSWRLIKEADKEALQEELERFINIPLERKLAINAFSLAPKDAFTLFLNHYDTCRRI